MTRAASYARDDKGCVLRSRRQGLRPTLATTRAASYARDDKGCVLRSRRQGPRPMLAITSAGSPRYAILQQLACVTQRRFVGFAGEHAGEFGFAIGGGDFAHEDRRAVLLLGF